MEAVALSLSCSLNHPTYKDYDQRLWNTARGPCAGHQLLEVEDGSGGNQVKEEVSGQYTAVDCPYGVNRVLGLGGVAEKFFNCIVLFVIFSASG